MEDEFKQKLQKRETWLRGLYMLIFLIAYGIAKFILVVISIYQFFSLLFTGETNEKLIKLGQNLGSYVYQIVMFLTFNSEWLPFPFNDWPDGPPNVQNNASEDPPKALDE